MMQQDRNSLQSLKDWLNEVLRKNENKEFTQAFTDFVRRIERIINELEPRAGVILAKNTESLKNDETNKAANYMKCTEVGTQTGSTDKQDCGIVSVSNDDIYTITCSFCDKQFPLWHWINFMSHMKERHQTQKNTLIDVQNQLDVLLVQSEETPNDKISGGNFTYIEETAYEMEAESISNTFPVGEETGEDIIIDSVLDIYNTENEQVNSRNDINTYEAVSRAKIRQSADEQILFEMTSFKSIMEFIELLKEYPMLWHKREKQKNEYNEALLKFTKRFNEKQNLSFSTMKMSKSIARIQNWYKNIVGEGKDSKTFYNPSYKDYFNICSGFAPKRTERNSEIVLETNNGGTGHNITEFALRIEPEIIGAGRGTDFTTINELQENVEMLLKANNKKSEPQQMSEKEGGMGFTTSNQLKVKNNKTKKEFIAGNESPQNVESLINTSGSTWNVSEEETKLMQPKADIKRESQDNEHNGVRCERCNKLYMGDLNLTAHKFIFHNIGELPYKCAHCQMSFRFEKAAKEHELTHQAASFVCEICSAKYLNEKDLNTHKKVHALEKSLICEYCGKKFTKSKFRIYHEQRHKEPKHRCTICNKGFYTNFNFKVHMKQHQDQRDYICEICGISFVLQSAFMIHQKAVHQEFYNCKICNVKLASGCSLNKHRRKYHLVREGTIEQLHLPLRERPTRYKHIFDPSTNTKRIQCKHCDQTFQNYACLRRHLRSKHGYKQKKKPKKIQTQASADINDMEKLNVDQEMFDLSHEINVVW